MRARGIKPGFFTDENVVELSAWARLLFIGLWCIADREGRLEDKPRQLKIQLFPCDNVKIDALLNEIERTGLIRRYQVKDGRYIHVVHFLKHQTPHIKEQASTLPAPDMHGASPGHAALFSDSCSLTPDSCKETLPHAEPQNEADADGFEAWWSAWPRKKDRGHAVRAYKAALQKATCEELLAGLTAQLPDLQSREPKFVPYPATWLNGERWKDEVPKVLSALEECDAYWGQQNGGDE